MGNKQYNINLEDVNSEIFTKVNPKLRYVSYSRYETDWPSIMHSHPFTEIFYVLNGKGRFFIDDMDFEVKEDDLIIVNANVSHTESSKNKEPLEYIVLGIDEISILKDEDGQTSYYNIQNYTDYKQDVRFYLNTLLKEAQTKGKFYELISQNLLEILIINIIRRTNTKLTVTDSKELMGNCSFVKRYIDEHFSEDICLDDLCNVSFMNKFYLVHAFKKDTGMTPGVYIYEKRLKKACHMLIDTNYSIAQIAESVGMSSQSYFAQAFKKKYNVSPLHYRKTHQNLEN